MNKRRGIAVAMPALLSFSCSSTAVAPSNEPDPRTPETGVGVLTYWNADLRVVKPGLVAAAVLGLETVELIDPEQGHAKSLAPPAMDAECHPGPQALVVGDFDGNSMADILVQEPCGNWLAKGTGEDRFETVTASAVLHEPGPHRYVQFYPAILTENVTSPARFIASSREWLYDMVYQWGKWSPPAEVPLPDKNGRVTDVFLRISDTDLVVQSFEALHFFDLERSAGPRFSHKVTQRIEDPYLAPFAGFDLLAEIPVPHPAECPSGALGIGFFLPSDVSPRGLQSLSFDSDQTFGVQDLPTGLEHVITFESFSSGDDRLVGVIGKVGNSYRFVLGKIVGCVDFMALEDIEIDFNFRTPPLPERYADDALLRTEGVKLVAYEFDSSVHFVHYDGYAARIVEARRDGIGWNLTQQIVPVHADRTDVVFK